MENQSQELDQFLHNYQDSQLLLTPNSRLRRWLLKALASKDTTAPVKATPRVFAMQDWINECWLQLQDQAWQEIQGLSLIDNNLRLKLWRQIIIESPASEHLINPELLSKQASQAYTSLQQWQISLTQLEAFDGTNDNVFLSWAKDFEQLCQTLQLISQEELIEKLILAFKLGQLPTESSVQLLAFDDLSPLLQTLIKHASKDTSHLKLKQNNKPPLLYAFDSRQDEIKACAQWASGLLQSETSQHGAKATARSPISIGIIDPALGQERALIERIFCETFEPQAILPNTQRYTLPFNFSAGIPLAETPVIQTGLQLLHLNHPISDLETLLQLLHSVFWGDSNSHFKDLRELDGVLCEHQLRRLQQSEVRAASFRQACSRAEQKLLEQALNNAEGGLEAYQSLHQVLQKHAQQQRSSQTPNTAKFWSQLFFQQLQQLGWPGHRRLDSNEFQQVSQFYQLLEELQSLDNGQRLLSFSEALKALSDLCHSRHYQAKTPDSPIQILGALEAAGMHFDYCWVLGMHAQQWPPKPQPSALLPFELQKQKAMPHASAERELTFARSLTEGYRHCAATVIFSYPKKHGDEELLLSPLLKDISHSPFQHSGSAASAQTQSDLFHSDKSLQDYKQELLAQNQLEWVDCCQGPEITAAESNLGGSAVLQQQASCPFNAFVIYRLGAREHDAPVIGLSPIERGNLLHLSMELLWRSLKDQHTLLQLSQEGLDTLINESIDTAMIEVLRQRFDLGPRFRQLEKQRLKLLINDWMEQEKQRPPFTVVGIESSQQIELQQLTLNLRLDRVDRNLAAEHDYLMVIDYKTGEPDIRYWQGHRMQEPQLPLYTLSAPNIRAIAFAQLNIKGNSFKGVGEPPLPAEGVKHCLDDKDLARYQLQDDWQALRNQWQQNLEQLAGQYCHGDCRLDFKDINAQRYSEQLKPLQRLDEIPQRLPLFLQEQTHHESKAVHGSFDVTEEGRP